MKHEQGIIAYNTKRLTTTISSKHFIISKITYTMIKADNSLGYYRLHSPYLYSL